MTDLIDFAAPLGVLGKFADTAVVGWYMPKLIRSRNAHLARIL
ncbi:hypothetical protein [Actinoallomurus liliacearum]